MRRSVTQGDVARRSKVSPATVSRILKGRTGGLSESTVRKVRSAARTLGYDTARLNYGHLRRYPRRYVRLEVELRVLRGEETFDQGVGVISNLSLGGALLTDVWLRSGRWPVDPFTIVVKTMDLAALSIRGRILRFQVDRANAYGVEFLNTEGAVEEGLRALLRA